MQSGTIAIFYSQTYVNIHDFAAYAWIHITRGRIDLVENVKYTPQIIHIFGLVLL